MFPQDMFLRLPKPTALLLVSSLIGLTSAHVARQTPTTIPYRSLNVLPLPPLPAPTSPPIDIEALHELVRRQDTNTICGYINGDAGLAATCSAGSHCVQDTDHNVIGCCPNGQETCTAGVFTACVDFNDSPQTEVNPYVYTCTGNNVCYKNIFDGGLSQFGCGTASDLAATVADIATGLTSGLTLQSETVPFTDTADILATPTVIGVGAPSSEASGSDGFTALSAPTTSPSASAISPSAPTSSSSTGAFSTTLTIAPPKTSSQSALTADSSSSTSSPSSTAAPATGGGNGGVNRTGAIVGGTISGVAALAALAALGIYLWRRRVRGNSRQGPGPRPGDTQYISPMSGGASFSPLEPSPGGPNGTPPATIKGKTITHITGGPNIRNTIWHHPSVGEGSYPAPTWSPRVAVAAAGATSAAGGGEEYLGPYSSPQNVLGEDEIPLRQNSPEIEDFSRGFHDALSRIGEEDEEDTNSANGNTMGGNGGGRTSNGDLGEANRPLWLQSRRQSRNLMWT